MLAENDIVRGEAGAGKVEALVAADGDGAREGLGDGGDDFATAVGPALPELSGEEDGEYDEEYGSGSDAFAERAGLQRFSRAGRCGVHALV